MTAHEAVVPFVVKYFPEFPVWLGKASTAAQEALEPSVVRYLPLWLVWLGTTYTLVVSRDTVGIGPVLLATVIPVPADTAVMSP